MWISSKALGFMSGPPGFPTLPPSTGMPASGLPTESQHQQLAWYMLGPGEDQTGLSGVTARPLLESHGSGKMARGHVSAANVSQPGQQQPPAQLSAVPPSPAIGTLCSAPELAPAVTSRLLETVASAAQAEVAVALHELCTDGDIKRMEVQAKMLDAAAAAAALTAAQERLKVVENKAQQQQQQQQQQ